MQNTHKKTVARIYGHGRGWIFTKADFADLGRDDAIRKILSRLCSNGTIARIASGLYYYPAYSELLKATLAPSADEAARAVARKHGWRIQPSGAAAANYFGISTQVPGRFVYYSDGPSKEFHIGTYVIKFKKTSLKESGFRLPESGLIVQALKEFGPDRLDQDVIEGIRRRIQPELRTKIIRDTRSVAAWIHDAIKMICRKNDKEACDDPRR